MVHPSCEAGSGSWLVPSAVRRRANDSARRQGDHCKGAHTVFKNENVYFSTQVLQAPACWMMAGSPAIAWLVAQHPGWIMLLVAGCCDTLLDGACELARAKCMEYVPLIAL